MNFKLFKGFEETYPERIKETDSWYYAQWTPCSEAYEVPDFKNNYPGTRLRLIEYPSGKIFEPIKQEKNVFLERPVYDHESQALGIIRYDFNSEVIQVLIFNPECSSVEVIAQIPFSKAGDLVNLRLVTSPFALVKHDIHANVIDYLWPLERHFQLEENESLSFQNEGQLYTSKWIEDPDYREEFLIRAIETGEVLERGPGYLRRMPDGSVWKMTR